MSRFTSRPNGFIYQSVVSQNKQNVRAVEKSSNDYSCIEIGYQRIRSLFLTFKPQKYHIRGLSFSNRLK